MKSLKAVFQADRGEKLSWITKKKNQALKGFKFVGPHVASWMAFGILGTSILALVELGIAYFIPFFLKSLGLIDDGLMSDSFLYRYQIPAWTIAPFLISLGIIRFIGQYLVNQSATAAQEGIGARLRRVLIYRMLLHPSQSVIAASQCNYYLGTIFPSAALSTYLVTLSMAQALQAVGLIVVMLVISWKEALIGIMGLTLIGLVVRRINEVIRLKSEEVPKENRVLINGFERVARNWLLVKVLKTQRLEHERFSKSIASVLDHSVKASSLSHLAGAGTPLLGIILVVVIVFVSNTYWSTPGSILLSFLYIFIRFVQGLAAAVSSTTQAARSLPQFQEASGFFFALSEPEIADALAPIPGKSDVGQTRATLRPLPPSISLQNVSFSYKDKPILNNISLTVDPGKTLGIVGPSGSGKSTLLLLILGALKPGRGSVRIGERDARLLLPEHHLDVSYVGPEPFLFEGNIRDNLAYGLPKVEDEALWEALAEAQMLDVIKDMPDQLDHRITENGEGLSAGQKQRLCLARIFLRKPSLIILDEATANLDVKTEAQVMESLAELKKTATIIIVTHRMSTLKYADYVFDMEQNEPKVLHGDGQALPDGVARIQAKDIRSLGNLIE